MRIVGGRFKGRVLATPKSQNIRPTTDRTRESLFNIIKHGWPEKLSETHVLDVFAGTGALGFEAMSRGCRFGLFIEQSTEGRGLIRDNVEKLGLSGHTKIARGDATRPSNIGKLKPFDLVFADPPYGKQLGEKALIALLEKGWMASDALVVLEEAKDALPGQVEGFIREETRQFGDTAVGFFRPQ